MNANDYGVVDSGYVSYFIQLAVCIIYGPHINFNQINGSKREQTEREQHPSGL